MEKLFYTRKIQLVIDSDDPVIKAEVLDRLYKWRYICFKAANQINTHHYIQLQIKEMIYLSEGVRVKLADQKKDEQGILATSRMNTAYQVLTRHYKGSIPMHIISALNGMLFTSFNQHRDKYLAGERAMPCFRKEIPIPFKGTDLKGLKTSNQGKLFHFKLFDIELRTYLGKDIHDKRLILQRLLDGEIKLCTSSLVLDKGKIFLLAVFQDQKQQHRLDQHIMAEASLSLDYPILVSIGKSSYTIGSKDEYLYKRLSIQAAMRRKKRAAAFMNTQSRRQIKEITIENLRLAEKRYVNHKQHLYSKRLIDLCLKNKAATLLLVDQAEKEEQAKKDPFLMRNWGYYGLREKIQRKADQVGITLLVE